MIKKIKLVIIAALSGFSKMAFAETAESKIKNCLTSIYIAQDYFHRANGRFSTIRKELVKINSCEGIDLSADYADAREFRFVAKADSKVWAIDETKRIEEVLEQ